MEDHRFKKGAEVEVCSNEEGFRGSWYAATVVSFSNRDSTVQIEYKALMADEDGTKPLKESVKPVQLRPVPPRELRSFKFSDEVDAFYRDGWWEGIITEVVGDNRFSVFFRASRDQLDFNASDLRLHREWVFGKWVPPLEGEVKPIPNGRIKGCFKKGAVVELSSDEDGFQGAWFIASVLEEMGDGRFLVEHQNLRTEDDRELLKEVVDYLHLRPCPPEVNKAGRFNLMEEVDALYNDIWWVGIIAEVLTDSKYRLYFRETKEEMEFKHSELRQHQEWIVGQWVMATHVHQSDAKKRRSL